MATTAPQAAAKAAVAPEPMSVREVLGIKPMRRIWYAQIISNLGDFLALYAVLGVMTFQMHATPVQLTWIQISYMAPIALLGIVAGVFVDRWPLKATLVSSDLLRALLCFGLVFCNKPWHYYLVLAAISVVSSFFGPAQGVTIRTAVPLHGLRSANTLMQQVLLLMRILGPSIASLIVAHFGAKTCYYADAASFAGSACFILSVAVTQPERKASEQNPKTGLARVAHEMRQGLGFILHHAALLFVILAMAAGIFTIGCFGPLIAVYVRETLRESTQTFGLMSSMIGLGMLLGINGLNMAAKRLGNHFLVYLGLGGIAAGLVLMAGIPWVVAGFLGTFLVGLAVAAIIIPAQTLMQEETPPELMGRVGSTFMSVIFTAQVAGLLLSGILAELTSVRAVFALCAGFLLLLMAVGRFWMEKEAKRG